MHSTDTRRRKIEVWVRSFTPGVGTKRDRALERARQLDRRSDADVEIGLWGRSIERLEPDAEASADAGTIDPSETVCERLMTFDDWADRTGRTIEPFFRNRRVESTILGTSYRVWRLPTVAVAEYRDGELVHLAPCRDESDGRTVDAMDRLERLYREDQRRFDERTQRSGDGSPRSALAYETAESTSDRADERRSEQHSDGRAETDDDDTDERDERPLADSVPPQ